MSRSFNFAAARGATRASSSLTAFRCGVHSPRRRASNNRPAIASVAAGLAWRSASAKRLIPEKGVMRCVEKVAWRGVGRRSECEERVDRLGHFCNAAMAVLKHRIQPARIGEPPAHDARDLLLEGARNGGLWLARVEMIKGGSRPKRCCCGGKAARVVGDAVSIEHIPFAVVLGMHQRPRFRDARLEFALSRDAVAAAIIGVGGGGEISAADVLARCPILIEHKRCRAGAVNAGRASENALQAFAKPPGFGKRIPFRFFVKRAHEAHGRGEKQHLALENIPEKSGNPERDIDPRPVKLGERDDLNACNAVCRYVPDRTRAEIGKPLREIVSAGP